MTCSSRLLALGEQGPRAWWRGALFERLPLLWCLMSSSTLPCFTGNSAHQLHKRWHFTSSFFPSKHPLSGMNKAVFPCWPVTCGKLLAHTKPVYLLKKNIHTWLCKYSPWQASLIIMSQSFTAHPYEFTFYSGTAALTPPFYSWGIRDN